MGTGLSPGIVPAGTREGRVVAGPATGIAVIVVFMGI